MRIVYEGLPPRAFSLDAILKGLSEPLSLGHGSPEAYLTEGILASQAAPAWLRVGSRGREVMRQSGSEVECWRSADSGPEKAELELSTLLPGSVVRARCAFSPVPVWLGGERLEPRWERGFLLGVQRWGRGWLTAPAEQNPQVRVGSDGPLAGDLLFLDHTVGEGPCWDSLAAVPVTLSGPTLVDWVKDGVIVASEAHDLGCPGAHVVAAASTLSLDLTRFRVIPDTAHASRLEELKQRLRGLLDVMAEHRDHLRVPELTKAEAHEAAFIVVLGGGAALGLTALIGGPVLLLGAGLLVTGGSRLAYEFSRSPIDHATLEMVTNKLWPAANRSSPPPP